MNRKVVFFAVLLMVFVSFTVYAIEKKDQSFLNKVKVDPTTLKEKKSAAAPQQQPTPIPADKIVPITPPVPTGAAECYLIQDPGEVASYFGSFAQGDVIAKYFDPVLYCEEPVYPLLIHDVDFMLYDFAGVGSVDIIVDVHIVCHDSCDGPGTQIYKSHPFTITTFSPEMAHIDLPDVVCLWEPFFISLEYATGVTGSTPSFVWSDETYPCDSCHAWMFWASGGYPFWIEWHDFWSPPAGGCPIIRVSARTSDPDCAQEPCGTTLETLWGAVSPAYYWKQPPNDQFINMLFELPLDHGGRLDKIQCAFSAAGTFGTPDPDFYVWLSDGQFPLDNNPPYQAIGEWHVPWGFSFYPAYVEVETWDMGIIFDPGEKFHIGYSHAFDPGDTLSGLSDAGGAGSERASGWDGTAWEPYWDYDFMINAVICPIELEDTVDLGICDTLYVETFDCDHIYDATAGYDSVRVAIYVTHDSNTFYWEDPGIWVQDSISGFVIPLRFWATGNADSVIIPTWGAWNNTKQDPEHAFFPRSMFRHLEDTHTGDTTFNRLAIMAGPPHYLVPWLVTREIFYDPVASSGHFYLSLLPAAAGSRNWWEGSKVLLASITFLVYAIEPPDTMAICLDSTFWPSVSQLAFIRYDAKTYTPRHFLPVCDTIYEEFAECGWVSFDGSPPLTPPDVEVIGCDPSQTVLCVTVHGMCVEDTTVGDDTFQLISVPEMTSTGEDGKPRLPAIGEMIGLATLADTVTVTGISTSTGLTFENLHVFPLQLQPKCEYVPPFVMDSSFYTDSNYFSPPSVAEAGPVGFWHILPTSNVGIFPFLYNPVTDTLIVYDTICVTFSHPGPPVTDTIPRSFTVIYEALINFYDCVSQYIAKEMRKFKPHELFIVADNLDNDTCVAKLIKYKKKKGFHVTKMTAKQAGGDPPDPDSIKKTIKEFYEKPECCDKPKYVTLIGDHPAVPGTVGTFGLSKKTLGPDNDVLSDEWYELVNGNDYKPDLMLGRLPTCNPDTLCKIINKKIKNDTTAHDSVTTELLVASRESRAGDPGNGLPKTPFQDRETKELVEKKLAGSEFKVKKVYGSDKDPNPNKNEDVKKFIQAGVGEVNYVGHGLEDRWDGWDANGQSWTKGEVDGLDLTDKIEPIIWSMACLNNKIDHTNDCIGEHWIKTCKATAHFGASRTTLAKHGSYLDNFIHEAICEFAKKNETADLGHIINSAKAKLDAEFALGKKPTEEKKQDYEYAKLTILEYLLLGDPDQTKWTKVPKQPDVDHKSSIPTGPQEFTVTVESEGSPVEGAIVSLWKKGAEGDEVFEALYTDDLGEATFDIDPQTPGVMYVTVWGRNLKVYLGEVPVYIRGDANGDGVINSADVVYLINYLFADGPAPDPVEAGDANRDGAINSADVVYLLNYLFAGGPPPAH